MADYFAEASPPLRLQWLQEHAAKEADERQRLALENSKKAAKRLIIDKELKGKPHDHPRVLARLSQFDQFFEVILTWVREEKGPSGFLFQRGYIKTDVVEVLPLFALSVLHVDERPVEEPDELPPPEKKKRKRVSKDGARKDIDSKQKRGRKKSQTYETGLSKYGTTPETSSGITTSTKDKDTALKAKAQAELLKTQEQLSEWKAQAKMWKRRYMKAVDVAKADHAAGAVAFATVSAMAQFSSEPVDKSDIPAYPVQPDYGQLDDDQSDSFRTPSDSQSAVFGLPSYDDSDSE